MLHMKHPKAKLLGVSCVTSLVYAKSIAICKTTLPGEAVLRETKYRKGTTEELQIYINPIITNKSKETALGWEGPGSIPGIFGQVERAIKITIDRQSRGSESKTAVLNGFIAEIVQHEIDHLNGIIFTDIADPETFVSVEYYMEYIRGK